MKAKLTKKADHFVDVTDMVLIGSGVTRTIETICMSRYACYLTVQNADPGKNFYLNQNLCYYDFIN